MKAVLVRVQEGEKQTLGELVVYDGMKKVFECKTLELADNDNENYVSCIPKGTYECVPRKSEKYKQHYHITNVPDRDLILFHWGNFHEDTLGCVLVGQTHFDIDKDGYKDVTSSKATFSKMISAIGRNNFTLTIV